MMISRGSRRKCVCVCVCVCVRESILLLNNMVCFSHFVIAFWRGDCSHLGHMDEGRTPKQILFGELIQSQPFHGPKKRWRDEVTGDLRAIGVGDEWFQLCQDRKQWSKMYSIAVGCYAQNSGTITCVANDFSD